MIITWKLHNFKNDCWNTEWLMELDALSITGRYVEINRTDCCIRYVGYSAMGRCSVLSKNWRRSICRVRGEWERDEARWCARKSDTLRLRTVLKGDEDEPKSPSITIQRRRIHEMRWTTKYISFSSLFTRSAPWWWWPRCWPATLASFETYAAGQRIDPKGDVNRIPEGSSIIRTESD